MNSYKTLIVSTVALIFTSISPVQAESLSGNDSLPAEAMPMIEKSPGFFIVSAPLINNMTVMIVRVFNQQNEVILNTRSNGESMELSTLDLADGDYHYEVKIIYRLDQPVDEDGEFHSEAVHREAGSFTVKYSEILQPDQIPADEEIGLLDLLTDSALALIGKSMATLLPAASAQNLVTKSATPNIGFNDTDAGASCCEWSITGTGSSTSGSFVIKDQIGANGNQVFKINGIAGDNDNANSIRIESTGNISWANFGMNFFKSSGHLSIGSTLAPATLSIYSILPEIRLHDETDTSEVSLWLDNGIMNFRGREVDTNSFTDIFTYHTNAPADSLNIANTGTVTMGDAGSGFSFQSSLAGAGLHIGDTSHTSKSLFISSTDNPEIFMAKTGVSGIELSLSSANFSISTDADGDGDIDNTNVLMIHNSAPGFSYGILANGDIQFGNYSMYLNKANRSLTIGSNGSTNPSAFNISKSVPDIRLISISGVTNEAELELSGSKMSFKGLFPGGILTDIMSYRTNAPANSFIISSDGYLGAGTDTPLAAIHVQRADNNANILIEETSATKTARTLFEIKNNGNPEFRMTNSGNSNSWLFSAGLRFVVKNNAGDWVSRVDTNGNMEITGALTTTGGTCGGGGCDLLFHPDTKIESIEEHAASMWANSYLPAVGPTVENQPFNLTEKTGGMLNELEKAHVYIEQLNKALTKQNQQLNSKLVDQNLQIATLRTEQAELKNAVMLLIRQKDNTILLTGN